MRNLSVTTRILVAVVKSSLQVLALSALLGISAQAQSSSNTDGTTPLSLTPGAPSGSYALSGFDNINLFNGNLNFGLPLLTVGGRGDARMQVTLPIEQHWRVESYYYQYGAYYIYSPNYNWWTGLKTGYGPGVLHGRTTVLATSDHCMPDGSWITAARIVTRLTFTAPDGTEYELRDQLTGGRPLDNSACVAQGPSRGTVFISGDGSAATFLSDTTIYDNVFTGTDPNPIFYPTGYLMLRNGIRYRIQNGLVMWMRDRNGNKLTFAYDNYAPNYTPANRVISITDSVNRQITISYDVQEGSPYGLCDKIQFHSFGGATRTIRVSKTSLGNVLRPDFTLKTYYQLFPEFNGSCSTCTHNPTVTSAVWLPDNRAYTFFYNSYGELARVKLPTGGSVEYDFGPGLSNGPASGALGDQSLYRRVVEKRSYTDDNFLAGRSIFSRPETIGPPPYYGTENTGFVDVDGLDLSGNRVSRNRHYFYGAASDQSDGTDDGYPKWQSGREYETQAIDVDGSTVLRRTTQTWQQRAPVPWWSSWCPTYYCSTHPELEPANDPRIAESQTELTDTNPGQVSKQVFSYDDSVPFNNQNNVKEYNYGSGAPGALLRETRTTYVTASNYSGTSVHLRSLPTQTSVFESGVERARTTYEYDNYAPVSPHAALVDRPSISGLDPTFSTSNTFRGNATGTSRYLLTNGAVTGSISAYTQYDIAGNVLKAIDARGYATNLYYDDCFGAPNGNAHLNSAPLELSSVGQASYAFATSVTNAMGQTSFSKFDYYTGRPVDGEDVNGIVSSGYSDYEALDRPTKVIRAVNTSAQNQTIFAYDDAGRIITTSSDLNTNGDGALVSKVLYDGLGRTTETRQYEGGTNYLATQQQYDALGRAYKTSNPFRPWQSESPVWTTTGFDALGRVISVTTPDNAVASTAYSGSQVLVTDQTGKQRMSKTNALGQLKDVWEITAADSATEAISFPGHTEVTAGYHTSYSYDLLDDLTNVTQGTQPQRTFAYNSLKRLTSATNPESGTISYQYDDNGNLTVKTDARGVSAHYAYDALNRVVRGWYNGSSLPTDVANNNPALPPGVAASDEVKFYYDSASLPNGAPTFDRGYATGRLVAVTYGGGSAGTYRGYDALGRVIRQYQQTDAVNYLVEASYNLGSAMTSETYPSAPGYSDRRNVNMNYDDAGRLASLNTNGTSYAGGASLSQVTYAPHGAPASEVYGNNTNHKISYNSRLQTTEIKLTLGTSRTPPVLMDLTYNYGTTNNNGNVQSVTYNSNWPSYTQSFTYDSLNRLSNATETWGGSPSWSQTNGYDRYGNRWIDLGNGQQNLSFNTNNNRITTVGYGYDNAGNLLNDGAHSYTYDAENKIKTVDGTAAYVYDGEGHRVRKLAGENTRFVYSTGGQLLAEFNGSNGSLSKEYIYGASGLVATIEPTAVNGNGTRYITSDHLGSPRVITNVGGQVVSRHDYKPFGEELVAGVGGRTTGNMYYSVNDGARQKFTSKERDNETGLDWFGPGRYYSSTQGRFTSVDPSGAGAQAVNPQSLNRYTYTLNRPTIAIDPDGLSTIVVTVTVPAGGGNPTASIVFSGKIGENGADAAVRYDGLAAGQGRDRMTTDNDTPYGVYSFDGTQGGTADSRLGRGFGTGKLIITGEAGEIIDSGRSLIRLHGGGSALGDHAYDLDQDLRATQGCVRMHNGDVNGLIGNIGTARTNQDPLDRVFIGTATTLTTTANQTDRNGNYVNPDLRLAMGMYSNEQQRQGLITADANRRAEVQRQREEQQRQQQERQRQRQQRRHPENQ